MPESNDASVVKIAVQMEGKQPILTEFDLRLPLHQHITDLANSWGIAEPRHLALKFTDKEERYITEKNKLEVRNGSVLCMDVSPARATADIIQKLQADAKAGEGLKKLSQLSADPTFAAEFVRERGLELLVAGIEKGRFRADALADALTSFLEMMEHGIAQWDGVQESFVSRVADEVNRLAGEGVARVDRSSRVSERASQVIDLQTPPNRLDPARMKALSASLAILENVVVNVPERHELIGAQVELTHLITHLQRRDTIVQQNALGLINALFARADGRRKEEYTASLNSKSFRNVIQTYVISPKPDDMGKEIAHQLYVLQTLNLNLLEARMRTPVRPEDADVVEKIKRLRKLALDDESKGSAGRKPGFAKDYQQLGFRDGTNPANDFAATPPGVLALDCMLHLANWHAEVYTRLVLENSCGSEHECPFGRTSIRLTALLCDILQVGEPPSDEGNTFYPMFFMQDNPFEEFFCICVNLLNKTWKEMRATAEDFDKVMSVVREQITRALQGRQKAADGGAKHEAQSRPDPPSTLEAFRTRLNNLTYSQINTIWQQEQTTKEESESQARPILELRDQLTPEMLELVQEQRLQYLVEGTRFTKYTSRGQRTKDKFWFVRLSPNHKVLHYGDCTEQGTPSLDELPNKLAVHDVRALVTGRDCPHMKDSKVKKSTYQLAFSLLHDPPDSGSLDFVAPDEKTFDYWTDGINALIGKKMTSKLADRDLDMLLAMEIKLRLLDTDGLDIPQEPPPIPPDPPNYDFCCD